jgi:hypothetical protein
MENILTFSNPFAQEQWNESLQRWPKTLQEAKQRATIFQQCKKFLQTNSDVSTDITKHLQVLQEQQKKVDSLLRESTSIESEGYSQVCFQGNPWSLLNSIPLALTALSIFKSYIVPAFSLLLPLLTWILPYLLLKSFYNIPISFADYTAILWRMWNGQALPRTPQELLQPPPPPPSEDVDITQKIKQLVQNGWTLFTIGQAMWQPVQQARHFIRLDGDCLEKGNAIIRIKEASLWLANTAKYFVPTLLLIKKSAQTVTCCFKQDQFYKIIYL